MICAAGGMLIVKQLRSRYNPWFLTGLQFMAGAVVVAAGVLISQKNSQESGNKNLAGETVMP